MRIIIITEFFQSGGLEAQILDFCRQLVAWGHEIHLFCGIGSRLSLLRDVIGDHIREIDMSPNQTSDRGFSTIKRIASYIREIDPDLIHLHPFTSIVYGGLAAALENRAYVATIHSPLSITYGYNPTYRIYCKTVLSDAWRVFCVSRESEDRVRIFIPEVRSVLLPNGIDTEKFKNATVNVDGPVAIVSRLDHDKIKGIEGFLAVWSRLPELYRKPLHIYVEGNARKDFETWTKNLSIGSEVTFMGQEDNLEIKLLSGYSMVAGMGRVIAESGSLNLPVFLVGYDGPKCLVSLENCEKLFMRNFSGRYLDSVGTEEVYNDLKSLQESPEKYMLRPWVVANLDQKNIWLNYLENVRSSRPGKYTWKEAFISAMYESKDETIFGESILRNLLYNIEMEACTRDSIMPYFADRLIKLTEERDRLRSMMSGNIWKLVSLYYKFRDGILRR